MADMGAPSVTDSANRASALNSPRGRNGVDATPAVNGAGGPRRAAGPGGRSAPLPRVPVRAILDTLAATYPEAGTALRFGNPFELLVATILSAQCTDKRVNLVTPDLFARFPTSEAMAEAGEAAIAPLIASCGLYRSKARNIAAACRALVEHHAGQVPDRMEALIALPGVGRKTANVVLSNAFAVPAIAVDTHVFRVANRLGLARGRTPEQVEAQLRRRVPRAHWSQAHHWLIWHGRQVCHARTPACAGCVLLAHCAEGRRRRGAAPREPGRGRRRPQGQTAPKG